MFIVRFREDDEVPAHQACLNEITEWLFAYHNGELNPNRRALIELMIEEMPQTRRLFKAAAEYLANEQVHEPTPEEVEKEKELIQKVKESIYKTTKREHN